jgi:hypothetical protein
MNYVMSGLWFTDRKKTEVRRDADITIGFLDLAWIAIYYYSVSK